MNIPLQSHLAMRHAFFSLMDVVISGIREGARGGLFRFRVVYSVYVPQFPLHDNKTRATRSSFEKEGKGEKYKSLSYRTA